MCTYSNIGDIGQQMWPKPFPVLPFNPLHPYGELSKAVPMPGIDAPLPFSGIPPFKPYNGPTKEQFEEFLKLMRQARKFDEAMGHPNCEQREKLEWMKGIAEYLGCDVSDLIPK